MLENFINCDICGNTIKFRDAEEFIDKSQGLKIYVCEACIKENEKREKYDEEVLNMRFKSKKEWLLD